jgi:hypothetical protein
MIKIGGDVAAYISSVLCEVCVSHCSGVDSALVNKTFDNIKMNCVNVKIAISHVGISIPKVHPCTN